MGLDLCKDYIESSKKTILFFMERHGFKDAKISDHEIKGKKTEDNVSQSLSIEFAFCSKKSKMNIVKATAWVKLENDFTNEPSDHMISHEGQFVREETVRPDLQIETVEKCMEYVFNQQQQYIEYLRREE
jgi:hypothetical protein